VQPSKYVPCFRLTSNSDDSNTLTFDDEGLPSGEPISFVAAEDVCDLLTFAVQLDDNSMEPVFDSNSILFFAMRAKKQAASGGYALVRTESSVVFRQVWFEGDDVRLHPMDASYPELKVPQESLKGIIPLFARYQRF
jgi:hypothetical protein